MNLIPLPVAILFIINFQLIATRNPDLDRNTLEQVRIDLRSKLATSTTDEFTIYTPNSALFYTSEVVKSSRLHSSQFTNASHIAAHFHVTQNSSVQLASNLTRSDICANIKYCTNSANTTSQCLVNLNQILYLTKPNSSADTYFNQIKIVKIDLVVSDFEADYLHFNPAIYNFKLSHSQLTCSQSQQMPIGVIKATSFINPDMNDLIRYYLEFKSDNSTYKLLDSIKIDETTGLLSLNMKNRNEIIAIMSDKRERLEFFVNARMQCSSNQSPLFNKTLVSIQLIQNVSALSEIKPTTTPHLSVNLTSLISVRPLRITGANNQCIKLTRSDLTSSDNSSMIALAQLQIESEYANEEYYFVLDEIRPPHVQSGSLLKLEIQYLVDNIYVVYLVKDKHASSYLDLFLNSVFRVNLKIFRSNAKSVLLKETHMFLCVDDESKLSAQEDTSDLFYELSLLQFNPSLYRVSPNTENTIVIDKLESSSENIKYFVDFNNNDEFAFDSKLISVKQAFSNSTRDLIELNVRTNSTLLLNNEIEKIENLQYELILVAYDSVQANKLNINVQSVYDYLKNIALEKQKFLHFTSKIIVSNVQSVQVNDLSIGQADSSLNFTFNFLNRNLVNNSIVGHLPDINNLELNDKLWLSYDRNFIQNYYYDLADEAQKQCYRLDKYDGTLYLINKGLFGNCSRRLTINLEHNQIENRIESFAEIFIQEENFSAEFARIQSTPATLIYNLNEKLILVNTNESASSKVLTSGEDLYFQLGFDLNNKTALSQLPKFLKLANLVSNFGALNLNQFELSSVEYKTKFESDSEFVIDSKKNAIFLNTSKLVTKESRLFSQSCVRLSLAAKNYIYLNSMKRKMISSDSFSLNVCFLNGEATLVKQHESLVAPIFDMSVSFQYLIRRTEQSFFYLFKNDLLSIVWYIVIGLFALGSVFLVSVLIYLNFNKKINDLSSAKINNSQYSSATNKNNQFRSMMNRICKGNPTSSVSTSFNSSSSSTGFSSQLKIRNDLSVNSHFSHPQANGEVFQIRNINQKSSAYDLNQIYSQPPVVYVPNKLDAMLNRLPLNLPDDMFSYVNKEESISEDQGVYCIQTGLSSCSSSPTESNVSSVTSNRQNVEIVDSDKCVVNINEKTKLSLFDMTPVLTANQASRFINKSLCKNKLMLSPDNVINEDMRSWVLSNYSANCSSLIMESKKISGVDFQDECII
jgi:hypothetical protein